MTPREKKLLVLLVAASFAAGANFLWEHAQTPAPETVSHRMQLEESKRTVRDLPPKILALPLNKGKQYALRMSTQPIGKNPFLPSKELESAFKDQLNGPKDAPSLQYTGYIAVGSSLLAILGGMEYAVGDAIPATGDIIHAISADKVVLYSPSRKAEWELAYSGDDF